jgi:hypothetical protein
MTATRKLRLALLGGSILAALSPVTVSTSGRLIPLRACADGTCCAEDKSICIINGIRTDNAYYKGPGSCAPPQVT